jgi:hypothetical protein
MPSTVHKLPPETKAMMAAGVVIGTAVAIAERSAAFVQFRWHQPYLPPTQNVLSAATPVSAAVQFSGNNATIAVNATTTATFLTFSTFKTTL